MMTNGTIVESMLYIPEDFYKIDFTPNHKALQEFFDINAEMPSIQEAMMTSTDSYSYLVPEVIAERIYEAAFPHLVMKQLFELVPFKGTTYTLQKGVEDSVQAYLISEHSGIWETHERYTEETVTPEKIGVRIELTTETIEDSRIALYKRHMRLAGEAMGKFADGRYRSVIAAGGTAFGGAAPITLSQILDMITTIDSVGWEADTIVMHPYQYRELMKTDEWKDAAGKYTATSSFTETMLRGEKVRLWGALNVIVTSQMTAGEVFVLDRKRMGLIAQNRFLTARQYEDVLRDAKGYLITERSKAKIVWADAVVVGSGFSTT